MENPTRTVAANNIVFNGGSYLCLGSRTERLVGHRTKVR